MSYRTRYLTTPCGKMTETNIDDIKIDVLQNSLFNTMWKND